MKRFVALICVLMMSMTFVCTAHAEVSHTCSWVLQNTGHTEYRSCNETYHKLAIEQISVCTVCGKTNGISYALIGEELRHSSGGTYVFNAHLQGEDLHVFYMQCRICNGKCFPKKVPCSGANGAHVQSP